jgi:hypothetical protein
MKLELDFTVLLGVFSAFFSAAIGLLLWRLQKTITKNEAAQEARDAARAKNEVLTVKGIGASIALGESTAIALRDGHTNGETKKALDYAQQVKHDQRDFLTEQGIGNLY